MEDEDDDGWGDDDPPDGVTPGSDCNDMFPGVPVDLTGLPVTCGEAALAQGSLGCEFHAVPLPHIDVGEPIGFDVALSNPSSLFTSVVTIEQFTGGAWNTVAGPFNVTPQSQVQVDLPLNGADTSGIFAGGSYRISSNLPIAAYQRSFQQFSTDASLLLPATTWADDYHVVGWDSLEQDAIAGSEEYVTVVSRADGTVVTVTPSQDIVGGPGVPATAAGVPFNVTLDEGEIAVVASLGQGLSTGDSLTGTTIAATNPIGVFTGSECSRVPAGVIACDHIEEQLLPAANASSLFVAARVTPRNTTTPESAVWQIYALEDVTVSFDAAAEVTGLPAGPTAILAGQALELEVSGSVANPGDFIVEADGNILLAEYVTGQNGGGGIGDPAMAQLPAQSQLLSDYAVGTYPGFTVHHLTITRETDSPVILDGVAVPDADFIAVGTSGEYEVARVEVEEGTHILSGDDPFAVLSTGYTNFDSYAYAGGLRTNDLVCTVPKNK